MNILYISFHPGTHINFDSFCEFYNIPITHLNPPNDYILDYNTSLHLYSSFYLPLLNSNNFSHIIISDTIVSSFPFFFSPISKSLKYILYITNYFDYLNSHNSLYLSSLQSFVKRPDVSVIYVDLFIKQYLLIKDIHPRSLSFIPLFGKIGKYQHPIIPTNKEIYISPKNILSLNKIFLVYKSFPVINSFTHLLLSHPLSYIIDILPDKYGGLSSLSNYNICIYIPYHYSTISLKELLSNNILVLIPSIHFHSTLFPSSTPFYYNLCDSYITPLSNFIIYFDSIPHLFKILYTLTSFPYLFSLLHNNINTFMHSYDISLFSNLYNFLL